jgi:hypothetical protein
MGYQTGTVGPLTYTQDNSGNANDTDTPVNYMPDQFGAPPGAQIITGTVQQTLAVTRGTAYVHNQTVTSDAISFMVYTQAASDGLIGSHSGAITVTTKFQWYFISDTEADDSDAPVAQPAAQAAAVLPNAA